MAVLPLTLYGDPVLRAKARPVEGVTDDLRKLVKDMTETMYAENGVGLAAPQIGLSLRIFVLGVPVKKTQRVEMAVFNPEVTRSEGSETTEEGCLSVPGVWDEVKRAWAVTMTGLDEEGRPIEVKAEGYLARAIQHEVDHINGVLFVDRLSLLRRRLHRKDLQAIEAGRAGRPAREAEG